MRGASAHAPTAGRVTGPGKRPVLSHVRMGSFHTAPVYASVVKGPCSVPHPPESFVSFSCLFFFVGVVSNGTLSKTGRTITGTARRWEGPGRGPGPRASGLRPRAGR